MKGEDEEIVAQKAIDMLEKTAVRQKGVGGKRQSILATLPNVTSSMNDDRLMGEMQDRAQQLGQGAIPRLQTSILLMKNELQQMVQKMQPVLEKMPSESNMAADKYQEFIGKLNPNQYKVE